MASLGNTIINGILRVNGKINAGDSITAPSFIGDLAGNAATATKANQLTTARTINGTSFNGTANITTANWGTARTIKIGNSGKSVNGSANVTWTLSEIGAAASSHTHSYLPLAGGTMTGALNFDGGQTAARNITWTGGTYQQRIAVTDDANTGTSAFQFQQSSNSGSSFTTLLTIKDNGQVQANTFIGALSGNATTATTLKTARTINGTSFNGSANITTANWGTARTIKIGNSGKSVNGSANVTWTLAEIGAAASSHTHSYLPLAGGTMTGTINSSKTTGTYLAGSQGTAVINSTASGGAYTTLIKSNSTNGKFTLNTYQSSLIIGYMSNTAIEADTNSLTKSWYFAEDGTLKPRS